MTATTTAPLTLHEWAVEVDSYLSTLWDAQQRTEHRQQSAIQDLHRKAGHHFRYYGRGTSGYWTLSRTDNTRVTPQDAADKVAAIAAREPKTYIEQDAEKALRWLDEIQQEMQALREAAREFEGEWAELRWSRFFIVKANNGHIHSSMTCSTCNRNGQATLFGWLPNLSGLTEKEAVDEHGTILCSVCFPSAPVEWTLGKQVDESLYCPASGKGVSTFTLPEGKTVWPQRVNGNVDYGNAMVRPGGRAYYWAGECPGGCGERGVTVTTNGKIRKHKKKG